MQNSVPAGLLSKKKPSAIRSLFTTAGLLAVGLLVAVVSAGGTYALWNNTAPVAAATVTTGKSGLTVNDDPSTFSVDLSMSTLLPGKSVVPAAPIRLKNVGDTALNVTAPSITYTSGAALEPYLTIAMTTTTAATCTVSADSAPLPASIAPIPLAIGQTVTVCLEVRLGTNTLSSLQGASATFLINLNATQVRP
jgi:predicted ribosomally synthesized peptide with SipW-like signal peptide